MENLSITEVQTNSFSKDEKFIQDVKVLLARQNPEKEFEIIPLTGGKNNRVFRVISGSRSFLLKSYFTHPADPRDRASTEFSFLTFAWSQGIRSIPEPLQLDSDAALALYEFIEGEKLCKADITQSTVDQAAAFFLALNQSKSRQEAMHLNAASEAAFSMDSHLYQTERRINSLLAVCEQPDVHDEARQFIHGALVPTWHKIRALVENKCIDLSLPKTIEISHEKRRLSPSDFGFHNAIKQSDGQICFLDFEYAGWDDVAKMICDFYLQPVLSLPKPYRSHFFDCVFANTADKELAARVEILLPVYQIKWCCIFLNEIMPAGQARRKFALYSAPDEQKIKEQVHLAADKLKELNL